MRNKIEYEWCIETIDNDGEILDTDFADTLTGLKLPQERYNLVLVANEGNEIDGLEDRYWAYVRDGKLPECFSDATEQPMHGFKVPSRFHKELNKYLA